MKSPVNRDRTRNARVATRSPKGLVAAALVVASFSGCTFDSWMDPSVVGRWESTPAEAPILERLDVIESDESDFLETTEVRATDLIPEIAQYIIGPGDRLTIQIEDLFGPGQTYEVARIVDETGRITLPIVGQVQCADSTELEVQRGILETLFDKEVFQRNSTNPPEVIVIAEAKQQNTYSVIGQVANPGRYVIPQPRFQVLDAVATAGGIPESAKKIYIIRQVPLDDALVRGLRPTARSMSEIEIAPAQNPITPDSQPRPDDNGDDGIDELIDELLKDNGNGNGNGDGTVSNPFSSEDRSMVFGARDNLQPSDPVIDVPTPGSSGDDTSTGRWVYLGGRWIQVASAEDADGTDDLDGLLSMQDASKLVTQRIIEIPIPALLDGDARYNIVVRPNDIIRVPAAPSGFVYMEGQIGRPGSYSLPPTGRLTLTRAIASAGGLGPLAIPERVDIIRMVGPSRQATVRLNLRAIYEMTEPDIYLKPDDRINIGTTWYASPLAVIRNGFRATYGFGFLLDRNFGNDVFGAPPVNRTNSN